MERFIAIKRRVIPITSENLKSSMERFIEGLNGCIEFCYLYLKSSMERFIVISTLNLFFSNKSFKIQYGEIYSSLAFPYIQPYLYI